MALRVRSSPSSWSRSWKARCQSLLPPIQIQSDFLTHLSGRAASSSKSLQRFLGTVNSVQSSPHQSHLIVRSARLAGECTSKHKIIICGIGNSSSSHLFPSATAGERRSTLDIQLLCSSACRNVLPERGYGDQCGRSQRGFLSPGTGMLLRPRFLSSQVKDYRPGIVETVPLAEQKNLHEEESLADAVEKDPFLQEVRSSAAAEVTTVETEAETVGEDGQVDDDDTERLEKAERDYLEALGNGEMADLDLEKLETLLGEAPTDTGDSTVGTLYLKLGQEYDAGGESGEQILRCGQKALEIFQNKMEEDVRLEVAMALHLIAIGNVRLEKYDQSLPALQTSLELLESKSEDKQSRAAKCAVRFLLGEVLSALGKPDEALGHLRSAVKEQELILGQDSDQLGRGYRKIAEVLANVLKHDEALPFIEKALAIDIKVFGEGSMEEALDRRLLAVIYVGLEDHEKALAQHIIVRRILSTSDYGSQTVFVDIATADTEITLGKYDDAISSLETAMSKVEKGTAMHALVLVNLAKAYERQQKPEKADQYAKEVLEILEDKVLASTDPLAVAEGFTELAALYERISQTHTAIDLLKKAHAIYAPIPHQRNAVAGTQAQIGMLLFFTGKVEEAIPFLEQAAENLEGAIGEQNFALAMVLNHLGVANVELERLEAATEIFERAKAIFDEVLGADHDDTIAVARNLVNTYSLLDRLDDAIKYQEEVISEYTKKGDEAKEFLQEAVDNLQLLQEHRENGKSFSQTAGSDARAFGRIISD